MENGVDVVERSVELGEKQGLVDGVSGEGLGEGAVIAPGERKDSEGEEFFQEAIGTKEQLPEQVSDVQQGDNTIESGIVAEQGVNVGHEDSVVSSDVKSVDESNVMVERGMDVEQGGSIVGFDVDTIPQTSVGTVGESLDVANEVEKFEEAVGVLREAENGVEDAIVGDQGEDSVDAATASGSEATTVKCNGEGDRELGNNGENWTQESAEVDAVVGMQNSKGGNENVETSGVAFESSETEESDNVVLQKGQAVESSENGTVHPDGESNGKILHEETENNGTSSEYNLGKEYRDEEAGHAADLSGDHNTEPQDDEGTKLTDTLASGGHEFSKSMEEKGATIELNSEHVDDNGEDMDAISNITHEGSHHNGEPETTSAGFELSANKGTELLDNQSSPYTKDSVDNEIQSDAGDLRLKDYHGSQPQDTGGGLSNTVYSNGNGAVRKELQNKGKVHEEQQAEAKKEQEVRPAADVGSSSAKSTNAATLPARPAGLGRAAPLLEPAPRVAQHPRANGSVTSLQAQQSEEPKEEGDEYDETREKLQMIRVKFLRLAHRLGQTPHNVVVAQVLYRLGLAEQLRGRSGGRVGAFSFDRASAMAEQLEAAGQEPLDFSCTIMVLGKTGVGKSATINSIFDEPKFSTDAFQTGTRKVQDVVGTVQGIKVRVIDTPGLLPSWSDQHCNEKILQSVKRFIKKTPPDIVLYLDRLDMQSRDLSDMPLLRTITEIFGPSIWFNAILVLTHAASAPPDGPNGSASSYDMFVTQRSHVVQQAIRQAAGDMRLMNPVSLVENHSACRTNRAGQRVLPNGQVWKPHLLLLSFASKILAEANALLKLQDSPPGKPFVTRSRAPPLPFLLSSLLQSRPQLKLPEEQNGDDDDLEDDLDDSSDSDDEPDYDDLPPFISLSKAQLAKLPKDQRKAYFDELEYREKLFMKKQLKEERKRRKIMKKMAAAAKDLRSEFSENVEEESGSTASVPVPMPDLALPASFDSDNPTHRYRYLDTSNPWLVRPVLETHGWDHDVGYEGINVERMFVVKQKVPVSFSGQVTKDKKDANLQMEAAGSIKHGEGKATNLGFDLQTVGKDIAYTLRSETRFSNYKKNKATAGLSVTLLGDAVSAGVKFEDKLIVNKRFQMVMSGGAMSGRGDIAYGGSLEAQLRDKDYPLGRSLSTLGLSVMDWHGDLAIGCNLQSQIPVGRSTNLIARANLNNRGAGQVSVRLNSSEQLQLVLVGLLPLLRKLFYVSQQQFEQ